MNKVLLLLLSLLSTSTLYAAQRPSQDKFLTPAEAVANMDIPEGFDVKVFVGDPNIAEAIAFCFDDKGRLWTLENGNYVSRGKHTTEKKLNRIQIFEDTDGDGVFDTKKLFTDTLSFSSGLAVGHGGVYVGMPPHFVFIPDANGDDKPDSDPEILLDGWGHNDRHETLNSFLWGPDGWLYGCHGVFTKSNVGKPGAADKDRSFIDGGIWRFHPITQTFEVYARGLSNPWGFDFNDVGEGFATACVIPHLFHIVQGGAYDKQGRRYLNKNIYDKIMTIRDHNHKSAHGGARFYMADAFPEKYRDQLFMCNIHQHEVLTDIMVPKGSGYVGTHGEDFLPANDLAWVGFSVEVGPEGAVYILDWHDQDICGNSVRFPDSARVYRIFPTGKKGVSKLDLRQLSDTKLVDMQLHANEWYVRHARTLLHERAANGTLKTKTVHRSLFKMLDSAPTTGKRLRALWALHVTGALKADSSAALFKTLQNKDEMIRAWSVQLLCEDKAPSDKALALFAKMAIEDTSAKVRLYLAAALQRIPEAQRWDILTGLVSHAEDATDHNIPIMIWIALESMVPTNPVESMMLAATSKLPTIQSYVPRRMSSNAKSKTSPKPKPKPKPAARKATPEFSKVVERLAPGFTLENNDYKEAGVFEKTFRNRPAFSSHPVSKTSPAYLLRKLAVPKDKKTSLAITVSHHQHGDWELKVRVNDTVIASDMVSSKTVKDGWLVKTVDLSSYAGKTITLHLENSANDWNWASAYWASVNVTSK
jgi:putative membrane-bound dehydrogenase-like protein